MSHNLREKEQRTVDEKRKDDATPEFRAGFIAEREGVKWWENPHPSGSVASAEWDRGHAGARRSLTGKANLA